MEIQKTCITGLNEFHESVRGGSFMSDDPTTGCNLPPYNVGFMASVENCRGPLIDQEPKDFPEQKKN